MELYLFCLQLCNIIVCVNERSSIYVLACRVCMALYVYGRCNVVLFQKNSLHGHKTRLLKGTCTWHVNGWYIGFGWKVHGMVHGKSVWLSFILQ